ncbi:MAG: sigma-70 family RNA polymerase sigma factor [Verrucomicrobia bacterium]|nr:sigma-70 family RNA polymerase sigma factor [Verrucomicrobiota bacterium]
MNITDPTTSKAAEAMEPSQPSDAELVLRSQRGDMAAFEELVNRYREKVYGLAYGMAHNEPDAQDIRQETFVRAWQSIDRFRGQSAFYTWLYRITTNLAIDMMRKKSRGVTVPIETPEGARPIEAQMVDAPKGRLPSDEAQRSDLRLAIDRAMAALSPEHRAVVLLKDFEGMEYRDIAKVVGCSMGTVMSRLFYARRHLQQLLRDVL